MPHTQPKGSGGKNTKKATATGFADDYIKELADKIKALSKEQAEELNQYLNAKIRTVLRKSPRR